MAGLDDTEYQKNYLQKAQRALDEKDYREIGISASDSPVGALANLSGRMLATLEMMNANAHRLDMVANRTLGHADKGEVASRSETLAPDSEMDHLMHIQSEMASTAARISALCDRLEQI